MRDDPQFFLQQYPSLMVQKDKALEKYRGHKTFGRQGTEEQWRRALTVLLDLFGVNGQHISHLSGKLLVFTSRAGLVQFSLERLNDWWFYWENLLRGMVLFITSAEQRIPLRDYCQLPQDKLDIYGYLSESYMEGRGRLEREAREAGRDLVEPESPYRPLTAAEKAVTRKQWEHQAGNTATSGGVSRQVVTLDEWQEYCASHRICKVLLVEGSYKRI